MEQHLKTCADNSAEFKVMCVRIQAMEKYWWIAFGALGVLQFLAPMVIDYLKRT